MSLPFDPDENNEELFADARRARKARVSLARVDGAIFNELVLRDEETGNPVTNAPVHVEMHHEIDKARRLVLWSHIESGKTQAITVGRTLFELGKNPNLRICIVSNTGGQSVKIVRTIAKYIESSEELHRVFPHLRPRTPWTHNSITVERQTKAKDASVTATGVHGAVLGARFDLLILDDILDYEITRTEIQRDELLKWYLSTLSGRVTANGRIIAVGTAWDKDDLMHTLSRKKAFSHRRFGVLDAEGNPTWPGRWPLARIIEKFEELGEIEGTRQLKCIAPDATTERFKLEWIQLCLNNGDGYDLVSSINVRDLHEGAFVVVGVDLGFTKTRHGGAKTVFFALLFYPDGMRQVLSIEAGNFSGPEIVMKALDYHRRFSANVYVESNSAQRLILDFALDPDYIDVIKSRFGADFDPGLIPVLPFQTGVNKWHATFGLESLGVELSHGKWIIPNDKYNLKEMTGTIDPEVLAWISEMRGYDRNAHTGDRLMSAWFAREGGRGTFGRKTKVTARVFAARDPKAAPELPEGEAPAG